MTTVRRSEPRYARICGLALLAALGLGLSACSQDEVAKATAADTQPQPTPKGPAGAMRTEHDLLGDKQVPADAYYGIQTLRGMENFQLSGVAINHYPGFVEAWAMVKLAAARANTDVGAMKKDRLDMIEKASQAVLDGKYHDQFMVDWYQGGAGTSTN